MSNNQDINVHQNPSDIGIIKEHVDRIRQELHKVIVGQDEMITFLMAGVLTGGHVLIEGVPGIAKTMTVNLLSKALNLSFKRLQFTPDLMPADVTGTNIFNVKSGEFEFRHGPVFANFVLIDEINRSPAKTQAALFEVMEEQQITVDGYTHNLPSPFMVMATQNPIEQEGTYKLPEAQQDRFLFRIKMQYPSVEDEYEILRRFERDFKQTATQDIQSVMNPHDIAVCKAIIEQVQISSELLRYIAAIVDHTRHTGDLFLGASPRASLAIVKTAKAIAAMQGRNFVTPDDIKLVAYPVLNHRVVIAPDKEMEGFEVKDILEDIFRKIEVPR